MSKRASLLLFLALFTTGCYSSTIFFFNNIRMKPVPVDVRKGLYKQEERSCSEKVQDLMYKIHEKNSHATHIRDLEVYKEDDGAWGNCYRLRYGLEITR